MAEIKDKAPVEIKNIIKKKKIVCHPVHWNTGRKNKQKEYIIKKKITVIGGKRNIPIGTKRRKEEKVIGDISYEK